MTYEQLCNIKDAKAELVQVRKVIAEQGEILAKNTGSRKQVLVCGGTVCTSSVSKKVIEALENSLKANGIEHEILVVRTGCFGLCA